MAEHCFSVTLRRGGAVPTIVDIRDDYKAKRTPVLMLGHGAGAGLRSDFMEWFATELAERGIGVVRFNFSYMEKSVGGGRRPPDRMEALIETYRDVLSASSKRTGSPPGPLFLGGKSMGGRVASMLVAQHLVRPTGMVYLGYPLHPAKKEDKLRSEHLKSVPVPQLFVSGDRDPLCNLELLRQERKRLKLAGSLHVVPGGDHSFAQLAANRHRTKAEMERAADVVVTFIKKVLAL